MFEGLKNRWNIIKDMFINSADLLNNEIDIYKARTKEIKKDKKKDDLQKNIK